MAGTEQLYASQSPTDIRIDVPHSARVYDYWLGDKDNFDAGRRPLSSPCS